MIGAEKFGTQTNASIAELCTARLHLHLIGPMKVIVAHGISLPFVGHRGSCDISHFGLVTEIYVDRPDLMRLLWSRRGQDQQRASLRQEIHRLQAALVAHSIDVLEVNREDLRLHKPDVWIDVAKIYQVTAEDPVSLPLLTEPLLEDFDGIDPAFDDWLADERGKLANHVRLIAEGILARQVMPVQMLAAAHQLLAIDPVHEGAWRAAIQAHNDIGDRSLAIQTYQRCRAALAKNLGVMPSEKTERLVEAVRAS